MKIFRGINVIHFERNYSKRTCIVIDDDIARIWLYDRGWLTIRRVM